MDLNYLRRLVKIFDDSKATNLEIEEDGIYLKLSTKVQNQNVSYITTATQQRSNPIENNPIVEISSETSELVALETKEKTNLHTIYSPIVGTFYRAPSPESPSFVEIGTKVRQGETLCIIEAMKLMNEIESDANGIVEKILVENGKPVEFNQALFLIKAE